MNRPQDSTLVTTALLAVVVAVALVFLSGCVAAKPDPTFGPVTQYLKQHHYGAGQ